MFYLIQGCLISNLKLLSVTVMLCMLTVTGDLTKNNSQHTVLIPESPKRNTSSSLNFKTEAAVT